MSSPASAPTRQDVITAEVIRAIKAGLSSLPELEFGEFTQDARPAVTAFIDGKNMVLNPSSSVVTVRFPDEKVEIQISSIQAVPA